MDSMGIFAHQTCQGVMGQRPGEVGSGPDFAPPPSVPDLALILPMAPPCPAVMEKTVPTIFGGISVDIPVPNIN